jgi:hypothetical protein
MSTEPQGDALENMSREEMMSALFAHMVFQNTNMALMLLGRVPHPETGEKVKDLAAARMFIDQLEMLEVKTKGNLTPEETRLLQQGLTHVRLAYVEAADEKPEKTDGPKTSGPTEPAADAKPAPAEPGATLQTSASPAEESESRKRFTKKY